jgi:DNA mismatch endonuclease (patch repair protein)
MAAVRTKGTAPEALFASILRRARMKFRCNAKDLIGCPDFVLERHRLVVFVDGDFWHGRDWFEARVAPVQNREFWIAKFEINRERDLRSERLLRRRGWSVVRFWASDLRRNPTRALALIRQKCKRSKARIRTRSVGSQNRRGPGRERRANTRSKRTHLRM